MKKLFVTLLTAAMILSMFSGCGGTDASLTASKTDSASAAVTEPQTTEAQPEKTAQPETKEISAELEEEMPHLEYPLVMDGSEQITVWVTLPPHVAPD